MKNFLVLCFIASISVSAAHAKATSAQATQAAEVYDDCKINATEFLKAPSTAKFPTAVEYKTHDLNGRTYWIIKSYVDSQNSFSAMLRSHFVCKASVENDHVTVDHIEFLD